LHERVRDHALGFDGIEGTADDIVIDAEGIVRTIDAGNGADVGSNAPIVMPPMLTITVPPATQAELALLNEAETAARSVVTARSRPKR